MFKGSAEYEFIKNNCSAIKRDIEYFNNLSNREIPSNEIDQVSRVVIVYLSFYLVALSDYLKNNYTISSNNNFPIGVRSEPMKIFHNFNQTFKPSEQIDLLGIQDVYTVRNKMFAHTLGITIADSNNATNINSYHFEKLSHLPNNYSDYSFKEKKILLTEFEQFINDFFYNFKEHLNEKDHHLFIFNLVV